MSLSQKLRDSGYRGTAALSMSLKDDMPLLMCPNKVKPDHLCLLGITSYLVSKTAAQRSAGTCILSCKGRGVSDKCKRNHRSGLQLLVLLWFHRLRSFPGFRHSHTCCLSCDPSRMLTQPRLGHCRVIASVLFGAPVVSNATPHKFLFLSGYIYHLNMQLDRNILI